MTKRCTKCGIEKPLDRFNDYKPPRGKYSHCKECRAANEKAYRAANAEAIAARRKADRVANPEKYRERSKAYYERNADAINARHKAIYTENSDAKRTRNREWNKADRLINPDVWATRKMQQRYGMTLNDYDQMLAAQGGLCANPGCFNEPPSDSRFHIDHDHTCCPGDKKTCGNCIRGLLCRTCNLALGLLQDDPKRIQGLLDYLEP